ncbi:glycosyltransferase 87 family protein [Actinoplanes rectilineatus]|uniref:glycosyltransferase 87 family protein n=1 Tax=Actinoplanes rectilineatus TaxID=113571 RepID=UPI000AF48735|nr:glycosyltransferase 87 family protein [Actinoplanes rectilineatus]
MRRAAHTRSVVVTLGVLVTLLLITLCLRRYELSTLTVAHEALRSWMNGDGLYAYHVMDGHEGAALSPVLALLLAPLMLLPLPVTGWLLALAGAVALLLAVRVLAGPLARRSATLVPALFGLALLTEPVRAAFGMGRVELLLFGLVVADLVALRRAAWIRSRAAWWPGRSTPERPLQRPVLAWLRRVWASGSWAGIGIGLASALCVTPLLFVAYLLVSRQRRAALTALVTALAVTLGVLAVRPDETLTWYSTTLWELDRSGPLSHGDNQSLAGVLARLYDFPAPPVLVWLSFAVLLLAVGLIRARSAHHDGDETAAFTLVGLTGAVIGPSSTSSDWIWLVPAVLILADAGRRRRTGARMPRAVRFAGAGCLVAAVLGYAVLLAGPGWITRWSVPALTLILLLNALPWRHATTPAGPVRRPAREPAIPGPRGG